MFRADKMVEISEQNISNKHVTAIEELVNTAAKKGKYYVRVWQGECKTTDTQLIFVRAFDIESYSYLIRMGYVITHVTDANGVAYLYVGWGFESAHVLDITLKASEGY